MEGQESGVPFLLSGIKANPPAATVQPEGHYDVERQVWIGPDGESISDEMASMANNDTKVDSNGYD